jgi:4-methylaminobutanoate oxidase (formaldehyde-forming)
MAVRETVGLYDISSFGKFEVSGKDALTTLQTLSAANIDVPVGKVVYTQWLNQRGGIEADLTICRVASDKFWVVTSIGSFNRDWWRLKKHAQGDTKVENISAAYACMALQGPLSRQLLESVTDIDLSFDAFPFGTGRHANIGGHLCWLQRISYVGELGWEIMVPADNAEKLYRTLYQAGKSFSLQNVGLHAVNSLRLEKGFRHWGHDIGSHDNLLEAGLNFVADMTSGDFIGYQALMTQRSKGVPERRLVQFRLENPDPLLYHNEPIVMNGEIVGYLTSGAFGHAVGSSIGMGYVNVPLLSNEIISTAEFEIEIALERFSAQASLRGWYDPKGLKMRQ